MFEDLKIFDYTFSLEITNRYLLPISERKKKKKKEVNACAEAEINL